MTGYVALKSKSWVGAIVFGFFVLSGAIWLYAYLHHTQGSPKTYLAANVTFLLRVLLIGGASVKEGLAHWVAWSHPGLGNPAPSRTPHVE